MTAPEKEFMIQFIEYADSDRWVPMALNQEAQTEQIALRIAHDMVYRDHAVYKARVLHRPVGDYLWFICHTYTQSQRHQECGDECEVAA